MTSLAQPLVGRTAELGSLEGALAELQRGRFAALELVGEPGIGKTRLLAELAALADSRRQLVLAGGASELEDDLPFWVFVDALDEYVEGVEPRRLDALPDDARAELSHVLPALADGARSGAGLQIERYRTHRAVRALLELLAEDRPLVLLLDDLHWADSGSIELLGSLLRRPPAAAVLLAMAMRPRQVPERLAGALARAERAGVITRLDLHALTAEEARELVGGAAADRVYADAGGNPFYLEQLARSAPQPGAAPQSAGLSLPGVEVPRAVAASLTGELAALGDATRRVLEGAAVAGDPFEPELAAAAAGVDEREAVDAVDELLRRDLIRHTDVPRRFHFRHPLVRGAVYASTPGGWRLGAHERTAAALAARGAPASARAHHVEHAGRHGDAAAVAVLCEAGAELISRTPAGAARWFEAALRLQPADAPAAERIDLLKSLAYARAATGRFPEARAALEEALARAPADAVDLRLGLVATCAGVDGLMSEHETARVRLEGAASELADNDSSDAVVMMRHLAVNAIYRQDYDGAREWAVRSHAGALALDDRALAANTAALVALASGFTRQIAEAERHRAEAAAAFDAMTDEEAAGNLQGLSQLASADYYLDRYVEGAAHAQRALDVGRASGQGQLFPMLTPVLGSFLVTLGRLREAEELLDRAVEAARLAGSAHGLGWALFVRASAARHTGDLEAALAAGEESVELAREAGVTGMVACYSNLAHGLALIDLGRHADGLDAMLAGAGPDMRGVPGSWRAYYLDRMVAALLALGRREQAEAAAAAAASVAEGTGLATAAMSARLAAARLALDAADADVAAGHALASAAAAEQLGTVIEAAQARLLAGRAYAQAGRQDLAMGELQRAAAVFDECGALRYRDDAERELRRLGHRATHRRSRPGKADGAGIESLTERELQVARLIVDRRTNPQIAAELFLSQKTVESHVRNLFHKLGASSRVEVARIVERAERAAYG